MTNRLTFFLSLAGLVAVLGLLACTSELTPYPTVCLKHETADGSMKEFCIEDEPAPIEEPAKVGDWAYGKREFEGSIYGEHHFVWIFLNPDVPDAGDQVIKNLGHGEVETDLGVPYISAGITKAEARQLAEMEAVDGIMPIPVPKPDWEGEGQAIPTFTPIPTITPRPLPTFKPTITPLPPGYVKPTELPPPPPLPTLETAGTVDPGIIEQLKDSPTPEPLADQVTIYTRTQKLYNYDVIAHVRVLSQRTVPVPEDLADWGVEDLPFMASEDGIVPWTRSKVETVTALHGEVPDEFEILGPSRFLDNMILEMNQEYVLFMVLIVVGSDDTSDIYRVRLTEEQLEAFGGEGWFYDNDQAWIIGGDTAWRIPKKHLYGGESGTHWAAAKAGGESMAVSGLVAAIQAGVPAW